MGLTISGQPEPGAYQYSGYYPNSNINYWTNANTSYGDFSVTGTIPSLTTIKTSNFGTVSKATSSLPGINFVAPKTGCIRMTVVASYFPGSSASAAKWAMKLLESTTSTLMAETSGQMGQQSSVAMSTPITLVGYFDATVSTTYNFKLQSLISTDTFYIGALTGVTNAMLTFAMEYIT